MDNIEKNELEKMVLAPYIQKATSLRGKYRYVGGNQFRHALSTFAILLDYHYMNPVLLKASFIHDVFEDTDCVIPDEIKFLDSDGPEVYKLVMEVTKTKGEKKDDYLKRVLVEGSVNAKILKVADRLSNLTDLHSDIFEKEFIKKYIDETKRWVVPMAEQVNKEMLFELKDLIRRREHHFTMPTHIWPLTRKKDED
jgi:(p)ppGpp synthase/HD superfamily hydrolase